MIDLSYLTEDEQEVILAVLKRDTELKKAEEDRIKQLQKAIPEEDKRKYMTGEWFYEAKSQRHQDRIHGSEIIMASMKQRKPTVVEFFTKSWGGRSRNLSRENSDDILTPKPAQSSDQPNERENSSTLDAQQERMNIGMRSPSKPRHNPFNSVPMELDFEETDNHLPNAASGSGLRKSSDRDSDSQAQHQEAKHTEDNTEVQNTTENRLPRQKPVPRKRTKIKLQSSFSDSASSVSTQSVSTQSISSQSVSTQSTSTQSVSTTAGSGIRSPPPRGILKHSYSSSSNESTLKSQQPQPVEILSYVRKNSQDSEECRHVLESTEESSSKTQNKEPKSSLPVRALSQMINQPQGILEKPKIQPRRTLSSITKTDDGPKVEEVLKPKRETDSSIWSPCVELEGQNISGDITETSCLPFESTKSAMTTNSEKQLDEITAPPTKQHKFEKIENYMTQSPNVETTRANENLRTAVDPFYSAVNMAETANKATDYENDNSPLIFNIKRRASTSKQEDVKLAVPAISHFPKTSDDQEDSIAKVLEWFSRSSDSSDKLDSESNVQDIEQDNKIDDIDFEGEVKMRDKTRENVYVIIPRQSEEKSLDMNMMFLEKTSWGIEQSVDGPPENIPKQRRRSESTFHKVSLVTKPSFDATLITNKLTQPEVNISVIEKVNQNEEKTEDLIRRDEEVTSNIKLIQHQPKGNTGVEENQRPKLANLKSFWEKENAGPKILISRSNAPAKNESLIPSDVGGKPTEGVKDQQRAEEQSLRVKSAEYQKNEPMNVGELLNIAYIGSTSPVNKPQEPIVTESAILAPASYASQEKDQIRASSPSDNNVTSHLKSSSPLFENEFLLKGKNSGSIGGTISISSSDGDRTSLKELEAKSRPTPRPNLVPVVKQNSQQQDSRAEKIKQLKSFWEKETWGPRTNIKSAAIENTKSPMSSTAKLNKRFTKSEFDLRSIGTEFDDDDLEDNTSVRGRLSPNFTMQPLCKDKAAVTDSMSTSQFKNLRDFWGVQTSLSPPTKHSKTDASPNVHTKSPSDQSERGIKTFVIESQSTKPSLLSSPAKTERTLQSPVKKKITTRQESTSRTDQANVDSHRVSHFPQSKKVSQISLKDTMPPKPQESRPQQGRRSSRGSLNGKTNAMRRASSMFSVYTVEQDTNLQSKKSEGPNLPQVKKASESNLTQSRKVQEVSHTLPKTSPDISWQDKEKNSQRRPSRTSEDSDSQPLARSFIPRDYQHYLGITENRVMYTPPPATEQMEDFICTSFATETSHSCNCSPVRTSTPQGSPELQTRRGSLGFHISTQSNGDSSREGSKASAADDWFRTKGNSNRNTQSPIQSALKRAASRPVYHKSLEDITTLPRQDQKIKQTNEDMQDNFDVSSTLVQTSFASSDPEHLKQLSKSVPSFLQKESDGGESDSESSSRSGTLQRNNRQLTNLSSYSGSASLSSVSGSVASIYSSDYSSVEVQGAIQFSLNYVQKLREFHIFVVQCQNLAAVDTKRNRSDPYVKSYLIPDSANLGKRKTAVKKRTLNPTYNEILRYRVRLEYLKSQVLNLSVWHNDTFGRNSFLGETELDLSSWDFTNTEMKILPLKPRNQSSQAIGSLRPTDLRGQMRLAIRFLPQISHSTNIPDSGEVHIWVKDCKNLPVIRSPSVDPFVKCFVLPDTSKKSRQKTRVLKRTTNPMFNHTMVYDGFRAEDLKEACVELTVWDRDRLANHTLGGLRLGMGTGRSYGVQVDWMDSTAEEVALWKKMMESPNEWVEGILPLRTIMTSKNTWK